MHIQEETTIGFCEPGPAQTRLDVRPRIGDRDKYDRKTPMVTPMHVIISVLAGFCIASIINVASVLTVPISISIYQGNNFLALLLFVLAGLSDSLDGFLARKYGWTSKFGEFADPVADKFLILSALLALAFSNQIPIWVASIMLARDGIIIVGVILYFSLFENYNLLPNRWGKHYTGWTISLFIIILLRGVFFNIPLLLEQVALVGTLSFLTLSIISYLKNPGKEIFRQII